jgi:lipopolysaccharide export system permease protein
MKTIERYIFMKIAKAAVMTFMALGTMVWLSQALRQFDLVTANGQSVWTFLRVSAMLMPALFSIVLPVALLIAVVFTFASLNTDSELVVINASGASQMTVLRPVVAMGMITMIIVGSMSLYFTPLSLRMFQEMLTNVRGDILTTIMREGQFMRLADGLTFHIRERQHDGAFAGIFLSDTRDKNNEITYLAEQGAILDNPLGVFLIMGNGTIQQRNPSEDKISMIEFSSYAFDLSSFTTGNEEGRTMPASERSTAYLLNPDPNDQYLRQQPDKFRLEIHKRLTWPLYSLMFAVLPLAFLGQAESARQSRTAAIAGAVSLTAVLQALGIFLPGLAESSRLSLILMYLVPLGTALMAVALILFGVQLRPPQRLVSFLETTFARVSGKVGRRAGAQAG